MASTLLDFLATNGSPTRANADLLAQQQQLPPDYLSVLDAAINRGMPEMQTADAYPSAPVRTAPKPVNIGGSNLTPQTPVAPISSLASQYQKPDMSMDLVQQMLSGRFQQEPTLSDAADAAMQSAISHKLVNPSDISNQRLASGIDALSKIGEFRKNLAMGDYYSTRPVGAGQGATMAIFNKLVELNPDADQNQLMAIAQKSAGQGAYYTPQGIKTIPGAGTAAGTIEYGKTTGKETAETDAERRAGAAKAEAALHGFEAQSKIVTDTIDEALNNISSLSTGPMSSLSALPFNTQARTLSNSLRTIQSNIGFDKLQTMRENSPTGGALGQVSDFENKLLQAVNGALDPVTPEQLKKNLQIIKELYPKVLQERRNAFDKDYGKYVQPYAPANTGGVKFLGFEGE